MVRALFYPAFAVLVIAGAGGLAMWTYAAVDRFRERRAVSHAQWEVFTFIRDDGDVEVGVRMVARWSNYQRHLRTDTHTDRVSPDDLVGLAEARARQQAKADTYNLLGDT